MVRLAVTLIGSEPAAEDLVHDAFVRVHAHWRRVEHPYAYLRTAVVNACRSAARRSARERAALSGQIADVITLKADEMFDALATLPYRQRAALGAAVLRGSQPCRDRRMSSAAVRGRSRP